MLLEMTEKIIGESAFEQKKRKPRLNLTLGWVLIALWTTGPRLKFFNLGWFSISFLSWP